MPLKAFQRNYWITTSTVAAPATPASRGGYPGFQISVIGSLWGACGDLFLVQWARLTLWVATQTAWGRVVALARRLYRLSAVEQQVATRVVGLMEGPHFPLAKLAVQQTAVIPGFQRPESWRSLNHILKEDQGRTENLYRHVQAIETFKRLVGDARSLTTILKEDDQHIQATADFKRLAREASSTVTHPQEQLLVELAYHAYTITGRRR